MDDWLERQAILSAQRLLALDPALLSPVGRSLLPVCEEILEIPDNVVQLASRRFR